MLVFRHVLVSLTLLSSAWAIGQDACISLKETDRSFPLFTSSTGAAAILVSSDDWPGVIRVATDFQLDISNVTATRPVLATVNPSTNDGIPSNAKYAVIIGSLNKSGLIQKLVTSAKLDISGIQGKWETYKTFIVPNPFPGIDTGYVIIGSDKRGAIFGVYEHSEQAGVSPWYYWADVPPTQRAALHAIPCGFGPPTVKYRGICTYLASKLYW